MCGRFATGLIPGQNDTADWLDIERHAPAPDWYEAADWPSLTPPAGPWPRPSWNVAPTQEVPIVVAPAAREGAGEGTAEGAEAPRRLLAARWGLVPRWWSKSLKELRASTFNARSEEAAGKPMFRDAWARGRCLVPALGYYEWSGKGAAKTPWFVTERNNRPGICFAGLWATATVEGVRLVSVTILTTAAGAATAALHPRSPVVLAPEDWAAWLGHEGDAASLMRPIPDARIEIREVSRDVGNVRNNRPDLVEPVGLGL
ncbi:MAG: SOS response-associated peptidase [Pseudomonadota bacterium]